MENPSTFRAAPEPRGLTDDGPGTGSLPTSQKTEANLAPDATLRAPLLSAAALVDCQSQRDLRRLRIDKVGVRGLRYPIEVGNRGYLQNTVARINLMVDLPPESRGTHMSRFIEVLNAHGRLINLENLSAMLVELQRKLQAEAAYIEMEFPFFLEKEAPVSKAPGLVDYEVKFEASAHGHEVNFVITVRVPVTTLCPCSKAISAYGAHNQRGYVSLAVQPAGGQDGSARVKPVRSKGAPSLEGLGIEDLVHLVEASASSEIYSLLKRTDEKFVTEKAFENPAFVEDLVRNVALRCRAHPQIGWFKVEAENMESIHNHSAYACIESPE